MPVQRIVMPDGSTKAFPEAATQTQIRQAIREMADRMIAERHPAARNARYVMVTQHSAPARQGAEGGFWQIIERGVNAVGKFASDTARRASDIGINDTNIEKGITYGLLAPLGAHGKVLADVLTGPTDHEFELRNRICRKGEPGCTMQNVEKHMPNAQFPSQFRDRTNHNAPESVLPFLPGPFGDITVTKGQDGSWTNTTRPGHLLEQGKIVRKPSEDNEFIYMNTEGTGTNKTALRAFANEKIGPLLFRLVDSDLRDSVRNEATGWDKLDKENSKTLYPYLHGWAW